MAYVQNEMKQKHKYRQDARNVIICTDMEYIHKY